MYKYVKLRVGSYFVNLKKFKGKYVTKLLVNKQLEQLSEIETFHEKNFININLIVFDLSAHHSRICCFRLFNR